MKTPIPSRLVSPLVGGLLLGTLMWSASPGAAASNDLASAADQVRPPLVGSSVPEVDVQSIDGKTLGLGELVGEQPSILIFYRGGW